MKKKPVKKPEAENLRSIIAEVAKERGISADVLVQIIESGISLAARKKTRIPNIVSKFNPDDGTFTLWQMKMVVAVPVDMTAEISVEDAKPLDKWARPGADVATPFELPDLGRVVGTTTRKIMQKSLRELEIEQKAAGYAAQFGKMLIATVEAVNETEDYLLKAGDDLAVMPRQEQAFRESFKKGEIVKVIIIGAEVEGSNPVFVVSRTHPLLLRHLFTREVPEIADGKVIIKSLARDTAGRSKVAVVSTNPSIDPVGACIGPNGARVRNIIKELKGENIDVIQWHDDPEKLITEALKPAIVKSVRCNKESKDAWATLDPDQQAVAVGKKGLNIRLASRLTHWNIHVN
ncbi:MAG: transcription termination factor NusA [Nitrospinae bacterium]|nr:transcription termination factor NusA [Nitrospinota bacterium]